MRTFSIKYNSKKALRFQDVVGSPKFVPGVNSITEAEWDSIKENVYVSRLFLDGDLEWADGKSPYDGQPSEASIPSVMKQNIAISAVATVSKKETLEKWISLENRERVIAAINAQLEKIKVVPEKKSSKSEKIEK